jgi:hypothetical protein
MPLALGEEVGGAGAAEDAAGAEDDVDEDVATANTEEVAVVVVEEEEAEEVNKDEEEEGVEVEDEDACTVEALVDANFSEIEPSDAHRRVPLLMPSMHSASESVCDPSLHSTTVMETCSSTRSR